MNGSTLGFSIVGYVTTMIATIWISFILPKCVFKEEKISEKSNSFKSVQEYFED